ncbi:Cytosolic phospholipase A2 zeta [Chelonia mydas]|uniref:Cytosolic phospholipase A2 zeta n=1 Tax=Chelonia mydas TaxID=8469 RepID=M7AM42_CHEMY|nr:Cytosolic phospholipase A2 zeta [Chelonia mydas]
MTKAKSSGVDYQEDVPNIAVLGAGGGLRAMIALHGTLQELQKHGLLDTVMYLCGVSGATWCMSSLYKNGDWAEKLQALEKHMCDALTKSSWYLGKATEMLLEAAKDAKYSLTEFWAYTVVYGMLHELNKGHLSEQRGASESGKNPYPIYAAVDEHSFCKVTEYAPETWFEFTPHEASFLGYGASVPTEYFGSEYKNGVLKNHKEEENMSYLQGLWGSCIGSKAENEKVLKDIFFGIFKGNKESCLAFAMDDESITDCSIIGDVVSGIAGIGNPELVNNKVFSLVDAGIAINCAYPLVLRQDRKVKLILSFDYGPGDPFKTLKQAAKYCEDNHIPFPKVDENLLQDTDNPSDCYVFRGEGAPTVMHFPLFNKVNCPGYVEEWRIKFTPIRFLYKEGDVQKLLQSARMNVSNNKDKILQEIKHIVACSSKKARS